MNQVTVRHLNIEELLLLADGELSAGMSQHFDGCVECQARLGGILGDLTTISSTLTSAHAIDIDANSSWVRLEQAISHAALLQDLHLSPEELLLLIDGDLNAARGEHAKRCFGCNSAKAQVQKLLWDVESDLRILTPNEPVERRMAAEQALKQHLYSAERKVVAFRTRQVWRYAAAATLLVSALAGGLRWNQSSVVEQSAVAEATPLTATLLATEEATITPEITLATFVIEAQQPAIEGTAGLPERFEWTATRLSTEAQEEPVVDVLPTMQFARILTPRLNFAFGSLPVISEPVRETAATEEFTPEVLSEEAYLAVLEARRWQLEAGLWRENVHPLWRDGRLAFAGSVESTRARANYVAAMEQRANGRLVTFDLSIRPKAFANGNLSDKDSGMIGGLVRTALLEHYRDAARRSFRSTEIPGLDGEIARYISEIFSNQNDLIGHAYQLDQLLNHSPSTSDTAGRESLGLVAELVRFHVNGAEKREAAIYSHLSEALPRRYWRYQGESETIPKSEDLRQESKALLHDVLGLERTLTTVFTASQQTLAFDSNGSSSGELLRRIHERLNRIKDLTRSAL